MLKRTNLVMQACLILLWLFKSSIAVANDRLPLQIILTPEPQILWSFLRQSSEQLSAVAKECGSSQPNQQCYGFSDHQLSLMHRLEIDGLPNLEGVYVYSGLQQYVPLEIEKSGKVTVRISSEVKEQKEAETITIADRLWRKALLVFRRNESAWAWREYYSPGSVQKFDAVLAKFALPSVGEFHIHSKAANPSDLRINLRLSDWSVVSLHSFISDPTPDGYVHRFPWSIPEGTVVREILIHRRSGSLPKPYLFEFNTYDGSAPSDEKLFTRQYLQAETGSLSPFFFKKYSVDFIHPQKTRHVYVRLPAGEEKTNAFEATAITRSIVQTGCGDTDVLEACDILKSSLVTLSGILGHDGQSSKIITSRDMLIRNGQIVLKTGISKSELAKAIEGTNLRILSEGPGTIKLQIQTAPTNIKPPHRAVPSSLAIGLQGLALLAFLYLLVSNVTDRSKNIDMGQIRANGKILKNGLSRSVVLRFGLCVALIALLAKLDIEMIGIRTFSMQLYWFGTAIVLSVLFFGRMFLQVRYLLAILIVLAIGSRVVMSGQPNYSFVTADATVTAGLLALLVWKGYQTSR